MNGYKLISVKGEVYFSDLEALASRLGVSMAQVECMDAQNQKIINTWIERPQYNDEDLPDFHEPLLYNWLLDGQQLSMTYLTYDHTIPYHVAYLFADYHHLNQSPLGDLCSRFIDRLNDYCYENDIMKEDLDEGQLLEAILAIGVKDVRMMDACLKAHDMLKDVFEYIHEQEENRI